MQRSQSPPLRPRSAPSLSATDLTTAILPVWRILRREMPAWLTDNENTPMRWRLARHAAERAARAPELLEPALGLAMAAWQRRPLDLRFAHLLEAAGGEAAFTAQAWDMIQALNGTLRRLPEADARLVQEAGSDPHSILDLALSRLGREGHASAWLFVALEPCLRAGRDQQARELLEAYRRTVPAGPLHSLADRLDAERELYLGHADTAVDMLQGLDPSAWGWWSGAALAMLDRARGDEFSAMRRLAGLWRATPWHLNLTLTLHDMVLPPQPDPGRPRAEDVAVCIYSWNKAPELERTLSALAEAPADAGGGHPLLAVLDNGSDDATPEVMERARGLFPEGRLLTVRLPVNVGAPAARNWLLSLPEVRRARAVAFLDDDVEPPARWLGRLLDAAGAEPGMGASAVGCLVTDAQAPFAVQTGEVHLLPPEMPDMCTRSFSDLDERIFPSSSSGCRDLGLWAYRRRCASVTGCCHLLPRQSLEAVGGFDVRFTPTRFDDLERDLRALLQGRPAVFDGRLTVRHRQNSSLRQALTAEVQARVMGNKIKLERLFSDQEARDMLTRQWDMLGDDLETRLAALGPALDEQGL